MKIAAIVLNVYALGLFVVLCALEGPPTGGDFPFVFAVTLVPIVNLFYIRCGKVEASWLGMYFKRKRLEEQKRIEALEKGNPHHARD